jgi:DNA-binding transcriptional regulator PaaX
MRISKAQKLLLLLDTYIRETKSNIPSYKGFRIGNLKDKNAFINALSYIKSKGYLEQVEDKSYRLSSSGLIKILKLRINRDKWDKKWRIITFDIPENKKKTRNYFRLKIKELGFKYIQKSVWIIPWDVSEEVEFLIDYLNIRNGVFYFISDAVLNEEELKREWNL